MKAPLTCDMLASDMSVLRRRHIGTYYLSIGVLAFLLIGIQLHITRLVRRKVSRPLVYSDVRNLFGKIGSHFALSLQE